MEGEREKPSTSLLPVNVGNNLQGCLLSQGHHILFGSQLSLRYNCGFFSLFSCQQPRESPDAEIFRLHGQLIHTLNFRRPPVFQYKWLGEITESCMAEKTSSNNGIDGKKIVPEVDVGYAEEQERKRKKKEEDEKNSKGNQPKKPLGQRKDPWGEKGVVGVCDRAGIFSCCYFTAVVIAVRVSDRKRLLLNGLTHFLNRQKASGGW